MKKNSGQKQWKMHFCLGNCIFSFPLLLVGRFVAFPPLQVSLVQRFGFLSGAVLLGL
jgi:nitrate reductase NapE component